MTVFIPEYRVKVNGTEVTGVALSGLTITSGRQDIYSQPIAGYCNLTLVETLQADVPYEINEPVTVEVKNTSGTFVQLFGGFITDVRISVESSGSSAVSQRVNIIAVGALARLARAVYTGNLTSDQDGDQIYAILSTVLFDQWQEVPAGETWATYDATVQWQDAENSGLGEIDRPGDYDLDSQNNLNDTVYNIISALATSGLGYIYEDEQGRIGYADSTHRGEYLATNGYVDVDAHDALGRGLSILKRAGDVRNSITISYTTSGNSSVTDEDAASIALYGQLATTIRTYLKNASDATAQAAFYLSLRAYPQYALRQITFPLGSPEMEDAERDNLLAISMGTPLNITNLPLNMTAGNFQGFVEGWTWTASLGRLDLTMTLSPIAYSLQAFRWNSVPATEAWNTISPTLDWLNATIVA